MHTKPTKSELAQMSAEMLRLLDTFSPKELGFLIDIKPSSIQNWKQHGYISVRAAYLLDKCEIAVKHGFTKEGLRPDVKVWFEPGTAKRDYSKRKDSNLEKA